MLQLRRDAGHRRLGLRNSDAVLQPRDDCVIVISIGESLGVKTERRPNGHVIPLELKACRQDADYRSAAAVRRAPDALADHIRIAAELRLP